MPVVAHKQLTSGLGFAICLRLIDEFVHTRPQAQTLTLIITTRDQRKSDDAASRLRSHLKAAAKRADKSVTGIGNLLARRVVLVQELLDLTSLLSVRALAKRLLATRSHIDVLILNAGLGGWAGVHWPTVIWTILTDFKHSLTWPTCKIAWRGLLTKPQLLAPQEKAREVQESPLGEVFCANVFGHYMLAHWLMPILWQSNNARIIWLSSLEAYADSLKLPDLQGITSDQPYESSKRLTDVLALSSELPEAQRSVADFLDQDRVKVDRDSPQNEPKMYTCHPGIVATAIFPLPFILSLCMTAAFYIARLSGSMWHTCSAYKAACAPVWLALSPQSTLDVIDRREGRAKWGSAVNQLGDERVEKTEVDGWGYGGLVGTVKDQNKGRKGRRRGATDVTKGDLEKFRLLGAACWHEMEKIRLYWENCFN